MAKRRASDEPAPSGAPKRPRIEQDLLSSLSDELLVRILYHVGIYDLTICQRVSRRLQSIATDQELWKAAYYDRFVRPRVSRLARPKDKIATPAKVQRWLDDAVLLKRATATNWKRQYKLRHKWAKGSCQVKDIPVASRPPIPPLLARLHEGVVYTVDSSAGLRAWSYKNDQKLLSTRCLESSTASGEALLPTSFAVDATTTKTDEQRLAVGFENGAYSIYRYCKATSRFEHLYSHPPSSNGLLYALAFTSPHLLTMSESQTLSLYKFEDIDEMGHPRLLTSLKSHTVWPPLSLSLRTRESGILAAIAYSMPTYNAGWSTGVQELHLTSTGEILDSRIASAHGPGFSTLAGSHGDSGESEPRQSASRSDQAMSKPTSLSYAHPYLLVSHSDNTLTLYMVTSGATQLTVAPGKRLWGHTSSVFGAHVESRGKAVSVSSRGDEVRVWELERSNLAGIKGSARTDDELSVQVTPDRRPLTPSRLQQLSPAIAQRMTGLGLALDEAGAAAAAAAAHPDVTRAWVGFDETNVVVLREQAHGRQALAVYDFS